MKKSGGKFIIIAVILALIASFFIYTYLRTLGDKTAAIPQEAVIVAAHTIEAHQMIGDADLKSVLVPKGSSNNTALRDKTEIIGHWSKSRIIEGEQFMPDRIATDNELQLSYNLSEGKRAVAVNVNEAALVGNLMNPGDFVDVYVTFEKEDFQQGTIKVTAPKVTKLLLQNIEVLGIATNVTAAATDPVAKAAKAEDLPKTVTLSVTPQDAEKLIFATEAGVIRLSLRPVGAKDTVTTPGIIRDDISLKGLKMDTSGASSSSGAGTDTASASGTVKPAN